MNIIIRADRKIGKEIIANHVFSGKRIIDRFIEFALSLTKSVFVIFDGRMEVKDVKKIPPSKIGTIKDAIILDLDYIYDERKLRKLIEKGKDARKAIIKKNKYAADLNSFGGLFHRKEWNPINQYYIEPLGEKIAFLLRRSKITANQVTFLNIMLSIIASSLIYINTVLSLALFGVWVRIFHMLDIVDGHIARLKNEGSAFGQWVDGGGDKLIITLWYIVIASTLYFESKKVFFLFVGLVALFGMYIYNYLLLTSVAYFRKYQSGYQSNSKIKNNPLVAFILLFINYDIHLHLLTLCAFINKMEWFLLFYAVYFNFMWFMYFLYYLFMCLIKKDACEV